MLRHWIPFPSPNCTATGGNQRSISIASALFALFLGVGPVLAASEVVGITEPFHDVTMNSPVTGIIGARLVEEGEFVRRGQLLIELDKKLEELDLSRKELAKQMSQSELERLKELSEKNAISVSREELDKKQTEFKIASVDLELAKEQLSRRMLTSPIDGYVTEIYLEAGEGCELRQPIIRVVETRRCYFVANIDAQFGHALKVGQKMRMRVEDGGSPVEIDGTISFVSPVVDPASGLMKVKLTFDNPDGKIRPGISGRLIIPE